jgi:hypothetical protein
VDGPGRAYPWETLVKQSPVVDHVNGTPLLIAVGPDWKSFRVFVSRIDGKDAEFFLKAEAEPTAEAAQVVVADPKPSQARAADANSTPAKAPDSKAADAKGGSSPSKAVPPAALKPWVMLDTATASEWNFQGCAISGSAAGKCLDRVPALKDYWFDWRNYHPQTTVYKH